MITPLLFKRHFQIAYVVDDIHAGVEHFRRKFGVAEWQVLEMASFHPGSASRYLALAWVGDLMIELIEPDPAVESIYQGWLADAGTLLRFHHLGFLINDGEEFASARSDLARSGFPIVNDESFGEVLNFFYADTRRESGHYLEVIQLKPEGEAFFGGVPRN